MTLELKLKLKTQLHFAPPPLIFNYSNMKEISSVAENRALSSRGKSATLPSTRPAPATLHSAHCFRRRTRHSKGHTSRRTYYTWAAAKYVYKMFRLSGEPSRQPVFRANSKGQMWNGDWEMGNGKWLTGNGSRNLAFLLFLFLSFHST